MFGRQLQLPGNVVPDNLFQVFRPMGGILQDQIVADAGADKYFFDPWQFPQFFQEGDLAAMIRLQLRADRRSQAAFAAAGPFDAFVPAFDAIHVGGGSAHILNDPFKFGMSAQRGRFSQQGGLATVGDGSALMNGYGAEMAFAVASPVGGQAEADSCKGAHRPPGGIMRMNTVFIAKLMDMIQLGRCQGKLGWVVDQIAPVLLLAEPFGGDWIVVPKETLEHPAEGRRIGCRLFMRRQFDEPFLFFNRDIADPAHIRNRPLGFDPFGQFQNGALPHAVDQQIGLSVKKNRTPNAVRYVVVVGKAPKAGLHPTDNDRPRIFKIAAHQVAIGDHCQVRAPVVQTAGGEIVLAALFADGGIVCDHRIHAAGGDTPEKIRFAQTADVLPAVDIGLGDDSHPVARVQQNLADDGYADKRRIHVGIPGHQDDIQ